MDDIILENDQPVNNLVDFVFIYLKMHRAIKHEKRERCKKLHQFEVKNGIKKVRT